MSGWLKRFVKRRGAKRKLGVRPLDVETDTDGQRLESSKDANAPHSSTAPSAESSPNEEKAPFYPFAKALGVPVPQPFNEDTEEPDLLIEAAVPRILDHFQKNRPGPASAPSLSLRVLNLVAKKDAGISEMVRLISSDPALSAGLLTVANSVNFRGLDEIDTVRAAVVRLGLEEVARIAGALAAKSLFNAKVKAELNAFNDEFARLYHRAITVATGAASVALSRRGGRADRAFLGGLLHDVGRSVALRSVAALSLKGESLASGETLERILDRVHVEIGAECHAEWSMPQYLTVIAVRHHERAIPAAPEFVDLHAVRLASALVHLRDPHRAARSAAEILDSAAALGMDAFQVRAADAELRDAAQRSASVYGL